MYLVLDINGVTEMKDDRKKVNTIVFAAAGHGSYLWHHLLSGASGVKKLPLILYVFMGSVI